MLYITQSKKILSYVMLFITKSDRTAIFITLPRPVGLGFETLCEHTRILGALVEHPQRNLEEIQQENPAEHPRGTCRPSGPQGPDVRHRELRSQPRTASENAGEAIRTLFG